MGTDAVPSKGSLTIGLAEMPLLPEVAPEPLAPERTGSRLCLVDLRGNDWRLAQLRSPDNREPVSAPAGGGEVVAGCEVESLNHPKTFPVEAGAERGYMFLVAGLHNAVDRDGGDVVVGKGAVV